MLRKFLLFAAIVLAMTSVTYAQVVPNCPTQLTSTAALPTGYVPQNGVGPMWQFDFAPGDVLVVINSLPTGLLIWTQVNNVSTLNTIQPNTVALFCANALAPFNHELIANIYASDYRTNFYTYVLRPKLGGGFQTIAPFPFDFEVDNVEWTPGPVPIPELPPEFEHCAY